MKRITSYTFWIVAVNFVIYLAMTFLSLIPNFDRFIFQNVAISLNNVLAGRVWTIITSMFMHGSVSHLVMNMFSLLFLGGFLERLIGSKRYLGIYFVSGIIGSLVFLLFSIYPLSIVPGLGARPETLAVGASGAIFGLAGMLMVLTPKMKVYILFIPIAMPLWLGLSSMLILFWILSAFAGLPIGNTAHLGGLITGAVYASYLRGKHKARAKLIADFYS